MNEGGEILHLLELQIDRADGGLDIGVIHRLTPLQDSSPQGSEEGAIEDIMVVHGARSV